MSQSKRADKKNKWLRLAVGATLLAGASGAALPGMASAEETTVTGLLNTDSDFYGKLQDKVTIPQDGWNEIWYMPWGDPTTDTAVTIDGFTTAGYDMRLGAGYGKGVAVTGNTLTVRNSTIQGTLVGAYGDGEGEVSGNTVNIDAGTKVAAGGSLKVLGGYSATDTGQPANNTVNILTKIALEDLKGGENKKYSVGNNGNTLNVAAKGVSTNTFGSFENINFFLPSDIAGGDTMLSIRNNYNNEDHATDLNGVKVGVAAQSGVKLEKGNTVNLMVNKTGIENAPTEFTAIATTPAGLLTDNKYTFGLGTTATALTATVTDIKEVIAEQPAAEQPAAEQPAAEQPAAEQPAAEQPAAEQPAAEQPAAEQPAAEQPAAEQPAAEQPAAEQPAAEQPGAEHPAAEQPAAEQPAAEQPAAEQPAAEQPAAEQPAAEQPAAEQPAAEQPAAEQPAAEQPAAEQPAAEQPAAEKPAAEQPAAEQPAAEQPAAEQPAAEQPAAEQPAAEQPAATPAAQPGNDEVLAKFTQGGISADNVQEYKSDVAGPLDPNKADSVSAHGVVLSGGTVNGDVYAGHSTGANGKAEKNAVIMTGGTVNGTLYGGHSDNGESDYNHVELSGGSVKQIIGGGSAVGDNNEVTVSGGDVQENVYGGNAETSASSNKVTIDGGTVNGTIYGGYTTGANGKADSNTVNVNSGTVGGDVYGGYSEQGTADGNTVTINGKAKLTSGWLKVIGGFSATKDAAVTNNTINFVNVDGLSLGNLQGGSVVYVVDGAEQYDGASNVSGNTMNFVNSKNISAHYFNGFSTINFYLPKDVQANDTILTVTDGDVSLGGVNVGVAAPYGLDNLKEKDSVNLIKGKVSGEATKVTASTDATKVSFLQADSLVTDKKYDFSLTTTSDALVATLDSVSEAGANGGSSDEELTPAAIKSSEKLKSLVETQAAAVTVLNNGTDMLVGAGFEQAGVAANDATAGGKFAPFAAIGGSKLRAESGSYVDVKGYGVNVGFAREVKNGTNKFLYGPVVEYGRGSYDSYQNDGTKADGKSSFWGVGLVGRQTNAKGVYYEGSLRAGKVKSDYNGNLGTRTADYESESGYWSAHLGWGKVSQLKGGNSLDTYVKYFYTRQNGDNVKVNINGGAATDSINFAAVESQRFRLGTRLSHQLNDTSNLYVGAAYQCETKGEARATYRGSETASPSVKGSSVLFELGWQVKPSNGPVELDLGVNGWAGRQRGITGKLGFKYNF